MADWKTSAEKATTSKTKFFSLAARKSTERQVIRQGTICWLGEKPETSGQSFSASFTFGHSQQPQQIQSLSGGSKNWKPVNTDSQLI